jgi:hypothetical protein
MQKTLVVITAILLTSGISHAADTTKFGVDSYVPEKFQDLEWRLNGDINFRGNNDDNRLSNSANERKALRRAGNFSSLLKYEWYAVQQYLSFNLNLNSNLDYSHQKGSSTEFSGSSWTAANFKSSQHNVGLYGAPRIEIGRYFAREAFLAIVGEGEFSRTESRYHSDDHQERHDTSGFVSGGSRHYESWKVDSRVHLAGGWTVGWGRVYNGEYAVTALEMIADLRRAGLLRREPTPTEYHQLCDSIYQFRRLHYFDRRDRQIEAVTALSGQLMSIGIIDVASLSVLLMSDVWQYYPRNDRPFGWRAYAGPIAIWDWQRRSVYPWNFWDHDDENSQGAWGFRGTVEYFRPISLRLQAEATADLFFVSDDWKIRHSDKHYTGYRVSGGGKYFFDSRTSALIHLAFLQNPSPLDGLPNQRDRVYVPYGVRVGYGLESKAQEFALGLSYRLAPPTTLSLSLQQYRTTTKPNFASAKFTQSGYYFSLGVAHWLY